MQINQRGCKAYQGLPCDWEMEGDGVQEKVRKDQKGIWRNF